MRRRERRRRGRRREALPFRRLKIKMSMDVHLAVLI
jgi:hypothetical protein